MKSTGKGGRLFARIALWALLSAAVLAAASSLAFADEAEIGRLMSDMAKDDWAGMKSHDRLVEIGADAVEALLGGLGSKVPRVRYWSAAALAQIGDERAYEPLKKLAREDPNQIVRATALWHLQLFERDDVYELAAEALSDEALRGWAMRILRENKRVEALPKLKELLKSPDPLTRADAVYAVASLFEKGQIEFLKGIVAADPAGDVRLQALRCLTVVSKDSRVLGVMIDALDDSDVEVRRFAVTLLRKGADQVFGYVPTDEPDVRRRAADRWRKWYEENLPRLAWNEERRLFEIKQEKE